MIGLLALWHSYGGLVTGVGGVAGGWYGRIARTHALERRDRLDAGAQALRLTEMLTARERVLSDRLDTLQQHHWMLMDQVQDVYAEAIAVRLIVHDLDAIAGRPLRQFRPLPPYPFPAQDDQAASGETSISSGGEDNK
ncbi:hypothetical protein FOH24_15210 [Acetobacter tropicalis]|uniref:Uncharacterized protein n=1 Tax=Acetobacter tropicalis TaxID=104102 RepID=A0A095BD87_9PROT|nr:hypothetical protein [Acetobacter tropicalis]KAA8383814.1 hypothetical protein FOH22_15965 [Acetobacter tropicalis]KAA8386281.1 hypothetical protein FOH24_15210 [Acetobacter tropicalis]KGB26738.1 hypothetical protein AtDm6_0004 [Acetobacter tropicalis]MDO8172392.1 hypothetical protein [Acetobacter tropicalis]